MDGPNAARYVEITFDCLPLRSIGRMDIPLDASPKFRAKCERIKAAIAAHGSTNTFYLHNAACVYHLTNEPALGMLHFEFDGTVMTDEVDRKTIAAHLDVTLKRETCEWLTEPIVAWFKDTVARAVKIEFDRYIAAGDLKRTEERFAKVQAEIEKSGGFLGMGL